MIRGAVASLFLLLTLAGCASSVKLADDKGQKADCHVVSLGLGGMLMAASMEQACVDQYQKKGYHRVSTSGVATFGLPDPPPKQQ